MTDSILSTNPSPALPKGKGEPPLLWGGGWGRGSCTKCCPLRLLVSIWFQFYFTLLSEYFSPFPHGTSSLSVSTMYLALPVSSGGFLPAIRVRKYSRTVIKEIYAFRLRDYHPVSCWFPTASSIHTFCDSSQ